MKIEIKLNKIMGCCKTSSEGKFIVINTYIKKFKKTQVKKNSNFIPQELEN